MTKENDIINHYQRERIKLEQKEDDLNFIAKKGDSMMSNFYFRLNGVFDNNSEADNEGKSHALRKGQIIFGEFEEALANERRSLSTAFDELEDQYRDEMRAVADEERN
ncbi:hypothetical protein BOVMAS10_16550 [Streptococcus uberis]|nr:hypothetical protein [Streptococcus uberis]MCK1197123.1 hypothetical protein [Streptococcus uberis]